MKRTTADGHVGNQYVDQDNSVPIAGTQLVAEDRNMIQEELANILIRLGKTLDGTRSDQIGTLLNSILHEIVSLSEMDTNDRIPIVSRLTNPTPLPGNNADKSSAFLNLSPVTINASGDINNTRNVIASGNISANGHITASGQLRSNNVTNLTADGAPNFPNYFTAPVGNWNPSSGYYPVNSTPIVPTDGFLYQIEYSNELNASSYRAYFSSDGSSGYNQLYQDMLVPAGSRIRIPSGSYTLRFRRVL